MSVLIGGLFAIFLGLGGWCLLTTSNVKAELPSYATKEYVEKKVDTEVNTLEYHWDKQFDRIYNKVDDLDKYIRDINK